MDTPDQVERKELKPEGGCPHLDVSQENDVRVCFDCGEQLPITEKEPVGWSYNHSTLCVLRKIPMKSIFPDVEQYRFPQNILDTANEIYTKVTKGSTYRGRYRLAIIFACIFNAFKLHQTPKSLDSLKAVFNNPNVKNLKNKSISKGLKFVNIGLKNIGFKTVVHITPFNLVEEILLRFNANPNQIQTVQKIYLEIENKSALLNRSRPQSVAASLVYWYMCHWKKGVVIQDFSSKVGLSELTISKLSKEIDKLYPLSICSPKVQK